MDFGTIIGYIVDYGTLPIVLALLIYLVISFHKQNKDMEAKMAEQDKKQDEREEKQREETTKLYERLLKGVTAPQVHTQEEEEDNRNVNDFVDSQLSCLLAENKANRAYVFMYHNGGRDIMGRSFQKMSITNEMVDSNTVPIMGSYQNVPRSMFPTLFKTLVSQDMFSVEKTESIKESDPVLYQMLVSHNVHTALFHGIRRGDRMVIGFVVIEYVSNTCEDIGEAEKNLEKKTLRISGAYAGKSYEELGR